MRREGERIKCVREREKEGGEKEISIQFNPSHKHK